MKRYRKAGIVACSNGLPLNAESEMEQLKTVLQQQGIAAVFSNYIYASDGVRSGTAKQRADALMEFYLDHSIDVIFDVSGGDVANEVLPYLDYDIIKNAIRSTGHPKEFWGYSDLTVLVNGIYEKTGNAGVLYQIRHLDFLRNDKGSTDVDREIVTLEKLLDAKYHFLRGNRMSGVVVGGNIRCFLKLAGTEYFPDMMGKILFLEARSGLEPQMRTYLSQLQQLDVFEKISGLYLGTFTQWERENEKLLKQKEKCSCNEVMTMEQLVMEYIPTHLPVVKTYDVGHSPHSQAITIGTEQKLWQIL